MFRIDGGVLTAESVYVTDNVGPFGVMALSNVEAVVNGDWSFERNCVCLGGSLFLSEVIMRLTGTLLSIENKGISEKDKTTAGLYISNSQVNINGAIESVANEGYITSIQSVGSNISLMEGASLLLNGNHNGFQAMSLTEQSKLIILNGMLTACNNTMRQRLILVNNSQVIFNGHTTFINNSKSPLSVHNAIIQFYGQIYFQDNAGVVFAVTSHLDIDGNSTFYRNNVDDGFKDGALAIFYQSSLKNWVAIIHFLKIEMKLWTVVQYMQEPNLLLSLAESEHLKITQQIMEVQFSLRNNLDLNFTMKLIYTL